MREFSCGLVLVTRPLTTQARTLRRIPDTWSLERVLRGVPREISLKKKKRNVDLKYHIS